MLQDPRVQAINILNISDIISYIVFIHKQVVNNFFLTVVMWLAEKRNEISE